MRRFVSNWTHSVRHHSEAVKKLKTRKICSCKLLITIHEFFQFTFLSNFFTASQPRRTPGSQKTAGAFQRRLHPVGSALDLHALRHCVEFWCRDAILAQAL